VSGSKVNHSTFGGIYLGANWQFSPNWFVGAEATVGYAPARLSNQITGVRTSTYSSTSQTTNAATNAVIGSSTSTSSSTSNYTYDRAWTLPDIELAGVLRVGFLPTDRVAFYGLAGWTSLTSGDPLQSLSVIGGPTVGAGSEVRLSPNWSLKLEYRFTHLQPFGTRSSSTTSDTSTGSGSIYQAQSSSVSVDRVSADVHAGRVGLTYYFGN
jgi:opacity protein-like surface antigen